MAGRPKATVASERHRARLVQLADHLPDGTPGLIEDAITGRRWQTTWLDCETAEAGWVSADCTPTLLDASEFTIIVPPIGPDGVRAADRFLFLAGTPDPADPTGEQRISYFPGDEWIEIHRDPQEPIAVGTPIDITHTPDQVQIQCRDVLQPLKKTRETSGGFWCNSPRDCFEHYTRLWTALVSDNFPDSATEFPGSPSSSGAVTSDGRWYYLSASNQAGAGHVRLHGNSASGVWGSIYSQATVTDDAAGGHGCWRAEGRIGAVSAEWAGSGHLAFIVDMPWAGHSNDNASIVVTPTSIVAQTLTGTNLTQWPTNFTGLTDANGLILTPLTFAIEARDRFLLFYVNGQLVSVAQRPKNGASLSVGFANTATVGTDYVDVDYIVLRQTTAPLNGGDPGAYQLPSPPAPGGLTGEYFDLTAAIAQYGSDLPLEVAAGPTGAGKVGERVDQWPLPAGTGWLMDGILGQCFIRWTGAIYLPLDTQDVHLSQAPGSSVMNVWVGRTRDGENILGPGRGALPFNGPSVGMRSLFGEEPGWYPIIIEFSFGGTIGLPSAPALSWDVGGTGTPVPNGMLAPLGVFRDQVPGGDSHYDTIRSIAESFAYQFATEPARLESPGWPGSIVPRTRVGRDTAEVLTLDEAISPQLQVNYEDVASALLAAAQGLGGNSSGDLTLEAFDFPGLLNHPFVSQESENLPATTVQPQLLYILLALLGYRTSGWESFQAQVSGVRELVDTFPLSGDLAEFDWHPGDALRVKAPEVAVGDVLPRQIFTPQRTVLPDGIGQTQVSFRPRNRDAYTTLRKFIRQVYGDRRTFQGQLVTTPATAVTSPSYATASLPTDLRTVRRCELVVLEKTDRTHPFAVDVNGTSLPFSVTVPGRYDLGQYVARQAGTQQIAVRLQDTSESGTSATYQLELVTLIPSL